jgi:alpha-amylase/alpha-mannosidase (GH57 family)
MADVALAFFWHQHQPYYPDDIAGENPMPWVRLHGVKDYYGMALHLLEVPEMRCTINLVPSLVHQLRGYTERGATDRLLEVARVPASSLNQEQVVFLLDNYFMANPDHVIRPHPRFAELYQRRNPGRNTALEAMRRFQEKDLRDLQVWFNLAWIHPLAFERDAELEELRRKARSYSEEEKNRVLDKHLEILRQVLPLHRQLVERGQIELTTTPFYHPILPLLIDKRLTREAMPDAKLPRHIAGYPEDAEWQVRQAVAYHEQVFGAAARGMWPAEGSVCQAMIPLLASAGIRWIATDEEILSQSTHSLVSRDGRGHVRNPEQMYKAYRVVEAGADLGIVFRDHALSDLIGFHYQRSDGDGAADDFLSKCRGIGQAINGGAPALVSVILDGENCWEHYPGGGVPFLRALYQRCVRTPGLTPVRVGEFLEAHPPRTTLPHLFAGSWIGHNFDIWIGHEEDNTGWDLLHRTREHLRQRLAQGLVPEDRAAQAWQEIYIAEGSDWFWWYGPHHSSAQDSLFDYLFRKHLQNVYQLLGEPPPAELARPISKRVQRAAIHTSPVSFLDAHIDGRRRPIAWMGAGRYTAQNERGTMAMVTQGVIRDVYFGFTPNDLLIRIDCAEPLARTLSEFDALRIKFVEPPGRELTMQFPGRPEQSVAFYWDGRAVDQTDARVGIDQIVAVSIPFDLLGIQVDQPVQFFVELLEAGQSRDRAPRDSYISLTRPSPDFERINWDV